MYVLTQLILFERLTVCVTRMWAGIDSAWEQKD